MISMAQFHNIKFLHEVEGLSQRQIAKKLGISRNTVSKYLNTNEAPTTMNRQKTYGSNKDYSDETKRVLPIIDQWLEDDLKRWGKQKHTAARIYQRLVDEYDFKGSESNITNECQKWDLKIMKWLTFEVIALFQFHVDKDKLISAVIATSKSQVNMIQSQLGYDGPIIIKPTRHDTFPAIA
jgi:predicted transcriptional regulator